MQFVKQMEIVDTKIPPKTRRHFNTLLLEVNTEFKDVR